MKSNPTEDFEVLAKDRWRAATSGFIKEIVSADVVVFTGLVDATELKALRDKCGKLGLDKPSWTALVVNSISYGLREHPALNRLLLGGLYRHRPVQLSQIHAVVAVERVREGEDTVYAQILRNTGQKHVWQITDELRQASAVDEDDDPRLELFMKLIRKLPGPVARWVLSSPRLSPKQWLEHRGGSFALTTVGKYGVDSVFVKWPWPLSFTFGEVKERPMSVDGNVESRLSFYFSLAWNREHSNGAPMARFFNDIVQHLRRADLTDEERSLLSSAG
jgi:pyruvate/2-oxoglutarate dehydrogenase complex dihydrolipoamide acyltransferase (E2) component